MNDCRVCGTMMFDKMVLLQDDNLCKMCDGTMLWGDELDRWLAKHGYMRTGGRGFAQTGARVVRMPPRRPILLIRGE